MSPLANPNPLAELHGIIEPAAASPWPPAPAYWLSLFAVLVLAIAAYYLLKVLNKQHKRQQQALTKLRQLQQEDASFILLNQLLKGVALSYFPRQQVASLHGEQWFDFLQGYATKELFSGKQRFLEYLYRYSEQPCAPADYAQAKKWIIELPKQIKKQQKASKKNV